MNLRKGFITLLFLLLIPATLLAVTPPVPSSPPERVIDLANIIEPALEAQLVSALRELETKTTAQIAVLTVSSLDGESIEAVSLHTFDQWKLGQKGKDNGLLLTVALKEQKYRFETGYGLESVLPDSLLGSIGREKLVPFFKEEKYGEGIAVATQQVIAVLEKPAQTQTDTVARLAKYRKQPSIQESEWKYKFVDFMIYFIPSLMVFLFIAAFCKALKELPTGSRSSSFSDSSDSSSSSSSSDSSWSSSDSSSSSSDSSSDFSGGGGDCGGGGSSGDW